MPLKPFDLRVISHLIAFALPNMVDAYCIDDDTPIVQVLYIDSTNGLSHINVSLAEYEKACSKLDADKFTMKVIEIARDNITQQLIDNQYDS